MIEVASFKRKSKNSGLGRFKPDVSHSFQLLLGCNTWLFLCICTHGLLDCWHCSLSGYSSWDHEAKLGMSETELTLPSPLLPLAAPSLEFTTSVKFFLNFPAIRAQSLTVNPAKPFFPLAYPQSLLSISFTCVPFSLSHHLLLPPPTPNPIQCTVVENRVRHRDVHCQLRCLWAGWLGSVSKSQASIPSFHF